jgi:hypothetical protein
MITIRRYGNVTEAGFAKSLLISEGIEASVVEEISGTLGPQYVPWGMRLQVREEDEERALEILARKENPASEDALEAAFPASLPEANPPLTCLGCGAVWELTGEELARPIFSCPECGKPIPHEVEVSTAKPPESDWQAFLPRSQSKWVFILTIVAFASWLQRQSRDTSQAWAPRTPAQPTN